MLLYSTMLNMVDSMSKENFIDAVLEWNRENPHEENRIPGIKWNGEREIRFGTERLWLEILEYTDKNIVAVRYEKVTEDGVTWDTDYIMNFNTMRMAIQLDRSYEEDALVTNAIFSTPLFISTLMKYGYIKDDGVLAVSNRPIVISGDTLSLFADAIFGKTAHQLPIVFVSKTVDNKNPVDVELLASRLKGAAHVMVQESRESNKDIRVICNDENAHNGAIGIYYPNNALGHKRLAYRDVPGIEKKLCDRVISYVLQFGNLQSIDVLYTWQGVNNDILNTRLRHQMEARQKAENARMEAQDEVNDVYAELDEELKKLQQKIEDLTRQNDALRRENAGLTAKLSQRNAMPVLYQGDEAEVYPGEIKDFVLGALTDAAAGYDDKTRKKEILEDIIKNNNYERLAKERREKLKSILRGYKAISANMKQELADLKFSLTEDGKHYKLLYNEDPRYTFTLAKTPSDNRSGDNIISTISNKIF